MSLLFSGVYRFDEFELNPAQRIFLRNGIPVAIPPKTFEVLAFFVANPGRVITKDELLKAVWPECFVEEGNLSQHVFALRKALADRAGCIVTVPGRGYQFTAAVQAIESPEALPPLSRIDRPPEYLVQHTRVSTQIVLEESSLPGDRSSALRRFLWFLGGAALAAALLVGVWAARRLNLPLTLRVANYAQLTRDGREKSIGGTDGSRVYFTEELPHSIAEVSVSGGALDPVPISLSEPWAGDVSPDGSTMLVISQSEGMGPADSLWSYRFIGHSLRRLANGAVDAAWSPDGSRLVFATAGGDIFDLRNDGTDEHKLGAPGGYINSLSWSPDGSRIRFSKDGFLWDLAADGSSLRRVLPGWSNSPSQFSGQWAPDGRYFFVSDGQIWALDERPHFGRIAAAKPIQLTSGPVVWDRPQPSRDGKTVFATGRAKRGELVRLDPKSRQLRPFLGGISAEFVAFTRDGSAVAYVSYPEGILWRANADGSNTVQLTAPPVYPKSPRWSPDGSKILFVDRTPKGASGIYVMAADGGAGSRLLPGDTDNETDPSWSPDGKKVVYSTCPALGVSADSDLRILDLASGKSAIVPGSKGLVVPHWSPDGKFISAMTLDSMGMKVLSVDSGEWSNLDTGSVAFPEWSHDGRYLYYLRWKGSATLVRMRPGDTKPEVLSDVQSEHFTGFFTSWMGLDSSDNPLLMRDVGNDEIYALTLHER
ncbi:MAG TPA: winged helix-turn-helix domain-containing protein [Acidobacteriaceae bacterium]|nr:winged helix-turn-helix domain-containing protein [Acidobacteriaceae bacterium]